MGWWQPLSHTSPVSGPPLASAKHSGKNLGSILSKYLTKSLAAAPLVLSRPEVGHFPPKTRSDSEPGRVALRTNANRL